MPLKPISLKGNWQQRPLIRDYINSNSSDVSSVGSVTSEKSNSPVIDIPLLSPIKKTSQTIDTNGLQSFNKLPQAKHSYFKLNQTPSFELSRKALNSVNTNISTSIKRSKKIEKTQLNIIQNNQIIKLNSNEYKIIKKIGSGGYSNVYMGVLTQHRSPINTSVSNFPLVAIKTRLIFGKRIEKTFKEIEHEIKLLKQYKEHSNVIQMVEHGKMFNLKLQDSTLAVDMHIIILEYAFIDLSSIIRTYPNNILPYSTTMHYFYQMVTALEALHLENIVHGDIKPANFVMCKERLKLIDFATSRAMDTGFSFHTSANLVCTPCYVAPEVVTSHRKKKYSVRLSNDIWGLGCVLYEMASGIRVHNGLNNGRAIIESLKAGVIKIDYSLIKSRDIRVVIEKCLELDERKRITISNLKLEIERIM